MPYRRIEDSIVNTLAGWDGLAKHFSFNFASTNQEGWPDLWDYAGDMPDKCVPYHLSSRYRNEPKTAVHFFIDDNRFESVWTHPHRAITKLRETSNLVIGPDFSLYRDYPLLVQKFNKYRSHWCTALWQREGFSVIPNATWGDPDTYEWCFEGLNVGGTIAIGSVGSIKNLEARKLFCQGYAEMQARLQPTRVLFYGTIPEELPVGDEEIFQYEHFWDNSRRTEQAEPQA